MNRAKWHIKGSTGIRINQYIFKANILICFFLDVLEDIYIYEIIDLIFLWIPPFATPVLITCLSLILGHKI